MADFTVKGDTALDTSGAQKGFNKMGGIAKKGFLIAGVAAAAAKIKIVSSAVTAYASYEQLVGGVDTLFKESSKKVQEYAENAYITSGLSANAYMETVTGFSASLLQSLSGDTEKAAEKADMAITDMADNANKMGTGIESIQNAYQGFAKQNYTMLDNLKLGYGGTKSEMERLLVDAGKISGIKYDISSYADVVDALHVMQTEMGITGTTALEAEETISGSLYMLKASYENLLVGLGDPNADLKKLTGNLVKSLSTFLGNIMPIIQNVVMALIDIMPQLIEVGIGLIVALINGIVKALPQLIPALINGVLLIVETLINNLPLLIEAGAQMLIALAKGLIEAMPQLIAQMPVLIQALCDALVEMIPVLVELGIMLFVAIVQNLPAIIAGIIKAVPEIITAIWDAFGNLREKMSGVGKKILYGIADGIANGLEWLVGKVRGIKESIINVFGTIKDNFITIGTNIVTGIWSGLSGGWDWLVGKIQALALKLPKAVKKILGISSPSKVFAWIGEMSAEGMAVGFEKNNPLDQISESLKSGMGKITANASIKQDVMLSGMSPASYNQVVNINQPVSQSPYDIGRAIKRSTEKMGLAGAI